MNVPLYNLDIKTTCNTSEDDIISNLKASKSRKWVKWLDVETNLKTKPLVICASGPSAWKALEQLPDRNSFDLMALNGAYNALLTKGIVADYYMQLDARAFNKPFVEHIRGGTTAFLAAQVHPDIYDTLMVSGCRDVVSFQLNTETDRKVFDDCAATFIGCPGGTVGMAALALAGVIGYRHLILIGYDSSYGPAGSHMIEQPQNVGQAIIQVEFDGRWYLTTPSLAEQTMEFFEWNRNLHDAFKGMEIHLIGEGLFYDFVVTNLNVPKCTTTREEELARYPEIYEEDPEYKCTDIRLSGLRQAFQLVNGENYLDVSCGRGESLTLADEFFKVVAGTETVPSLIKGRVGHGILPSLPVPDKSYDVVSLIEVIEHLVPDDVELALRELDRIARRFIILSAATFPSWKNKANLHPSARPEREWNNLFMRIWGDRVKRLPFDIHPSPAWLVTL